MRPVLSTLDRYLLGQVTATLVSVCGIVMSLMVLEHLARLFDIVRLSGRKGFILVQSMIALLPEYAGIGLLFGLYLAIALTVRRLSLRAELDVIQATGTSPWRWMRFPALLALLVAALLLLSQGWLMPAGEKRLGEIGRQMQRGQFGYALEPGRFIDLGGGVTVRFEAIDRTNNEMVGIFFRTSEMTFSASRGRLGFDLSGHVLVDLKDGRSFNNTHGQALSFTRFHVDSGGRTEDARQAPNVAERRKSASLPALLASADAADRAAAWSRLLWPAFTLMVPFLAVVLGKPVRRTRSSLGLTSGVVLLVLFIRSTGLVASTTSPHPATVAIATCGGWVAAIAIIVRCDRQWGAGFVDGWMLTLAQLLRDGTVAGAVRRMLARAAALDDDGQSGTMNRMSTPRLLETPLVKGQPLSQGVR